MRKLVTILLFLTFWLANNSFCQTNTFTGEGDGESWNDANNWSEGVVPTSSHDVVIDADVGGGFLQVVFNAPIAGGTCKSLTITEGAQLFRSPLFASTRFLKVSGDIVNNGTIGNGATFDGIGFEFVGTSHTISGMGVFDAAIFRRGTVPSDNTTTLNINQNINLRATSGTVLFNNAAGLFNVNLSSGYTINCIAGSVCIDGSSGAASTEGGGTFTIAGTLNIGGTLYITTNNTTNHCGLVISNGGIINCNGISSNASGTAGASLNINNGGKLKFLTGGFGSFSLTNNSFTFNGTVEFASSTDQTIGNPADYNHLTLSGSGTKSLSNNITVNGNLTRGGTAVFANSGFTLNYGSSSNLIYNGSAAQTTGQEFPSVLNSSLIINNPNDVTLNSSRSVNGSVTLLDGSLKTGNYTLFLTSGSSTVTESTDKYIIGELVTSRNVGTSSNTFGGIGFEINAGVDDLGTVTVNRLSGPAGINSFGANKSIARRWTVNISGSQPVNGRTLTFSWVPNDDNGAQLTATRVWKYDGGSSWQDLSGAPVDATSRIISAGVTSITNSAFTVSDETSPFPVELSSFTGTVSNNSVILGWITQTEMNNYGFNVERKSNVNGQMSDVWETIGFVNGYGNSNSQKSYSFNDRDLNSGKYSYRLKQIDNDGQFTYSNIVEVNLEIPEKFSLEQNYPNPFNPSTKISWQSPISCHQTLKLYDVLGNEVAKLIDEYREAGSYEIEFNASGLSSGVYYYKLQAGFPEGQGFTQTRKMILIR